MCVLLLGCCVFLFFFFGRLVVAFQSSFSSLASGWPMHYLLRSLIYFSWYNSDCPPPADLVAMCQSIFFFLFLLDSDGAMSFFFLAAPWKDHGPQMKRKYLHTVEYKGQLHNISKELYCWQRTSLALFIYRLVCGTYSLNYVIQYMNTWTRFLLLSVLEWFTMPRERKTLQ